MAATSTSPARSRGFTRAVVDWIAALGGLVLNWVIAVEDMMAFFMRTLWWLVRKPRGDTLLANFYQIGVLSLPVVALTGLFIGMVLAVQSHCQFRMLNLETRLGAVINMSLVRELGPVIAGLLFSGRAGSALTAEIGLMKATEQLDGMEMMAVDPLRRVVAPRFVAGVISMPLLAAMFSAVGVLGGYFVGVGLLGVDEGAFWSQMQSAVDLNDDILNGVIKSVVFGVVITWIAVFEGYDSVPTSEGVSAATTRTVVHSSLAVLGLDFVLTALMFN